MDSKYLDNQFRYGIHNNDSFREYLLLKLKNKDVELTYTNNLFIVGWNPLFYYMTVPH